MSVKSKLSSTLQHKIPPDLSQAHDLFRKGLYASRINILYILSMTLIPGAFFFDILIFPNQWKSLASIRGVSALVCLGLYLLSKSSQFKDYPVQSTYILNIVVASTIALLTYSTGGLESPYYAGQILIFICIAMIMPFRLLEAFFAGTCIIVLHYGINLLPALVSTDVIQWRYFWNSVYFLSFSFTMILIASVVLENFRVKIFANTEREKIKNAKLEASRRKIDSLLATKNQFLANITHELKTPLSIVIGNADLIMDKAHEVDETFTQNLKIIQQAAFQLVTHVDRLIAVTKADDPEIKLVVDNYDYVGVVRNIFTMFENKARSEGIELRLVCVDKPLVANIDIHRIEEVLNNLLQNAFKFTSKGGTITLTVGSDGQQIVTEVNDTGKGIAADQLTRVFERLYQVDDVLSKQHGGMGIGLYLCKRNIELHGGAINVHSRLGKGSTFRFNLPLHVDQGARVKNLPYKGPERRKRESRRRIDERRMQERKKKFEFQLSLGLDDLAKITHVDNIRDYENRSPAFPSVLIVEDNAGMMKVMIDGLRDEFNLFLATNGYEALEKLRTHGGEISLILSDIMMPGMSGYEFCAEIRKNKAWRHVPLVFVTALLKEEDQLRGYELGATDYITKPYNIRILKEKVAHWISRRQYEMLLQGMSNSLETQLQAASKMKSIILHEIRNPLQVITGAGNCLEIVHQAIPRHAVDQAQKLGKYLNLLQQGIESLGAVLETSQKIDENLLAKRKPEKVATLFEEAVSQTDHLLNGTRIELDVGRADASRVFCDRKVLGQVFVNIIRNAAEAIAERNPPEGGKIVIQARKADAERIGISFRDNGIGMDREVKKKLFRFKFTTKRDGTGVGLHFSKMIVKLHDGEILVDSIEGVGTEFQIFLPLYRKDPAPEPLEVS